MTIKRRKNKVTILDEPLKASFEYPTIEQAKSVTKYCRMLMRKGRGFVRVRNYLVYGREI